MITPCGGWLQLRRSLDFQIDPLDPQTMNKRPAIGSSKYLASLRHCAADAGQLHGMGL
jgi:hypothetical protein